MHHSRLLTTILATFLVGCGGALISNTQEFQIGKSVNLEMKKEYNLVVSNDPVSAWAREFIKPLVSASATFRDPAEVEGYQVAIIADDDLVNAFAAPGGFTYLSTGLILNAKDCAEIAGVMGHELAHVTERHGAKSIEQAFAVQQIVGLFLDDGLGADAALMIFQFLQSTKFSRADETEADTVGLQISHGAGYDPTGLADFFAVLLNGKTGRVAEFFSSHPATEKRIASVRAQIIERFGQSSGFQRNRKCLTKMSLAQVKARIRSGKMGIRKATGVTKEARARALKRLNEMRERNQKTKNNASNARSR